MSLKCRVSAEYQEQIHTNAKRGGAGAERSQANTEKVGLGLDNYYLKLLECGQFQWTENERYVSGNLTFSLDSIHIIFRSVKLKE